MDGRQGHGLWSRTGWQRQGMGMHSSSTELAQLGLLVASKVQAMDGICKDWACITPDGKKVTASMGCSCCRLRMHCNTVGIQSESSGAGRRAAQLIDLRESFSQALHHASSACRARTVQMVDLKHAVAMPGLPNHSTCLLGMHCRAADQLIKQVEQSRGSPQSCAHPTACRCGHILLQDPSTAWVICHNLCEAARWGVCADHA